jgi:hypothetical protein
MTLPPNQTTEPTSVAVTDHADSLAGSMADENTLTVPAAVGLGDGVQQERA